MIQNRLPFRSLSLVNVTGIIGCVVASLQGWPQRILAGDDSGVTVVIGIVFLGAMFAAFYQAWRPSPDDVRASLNLQGIKYAGTTLVMLGLLGTVLGASRAFLGMDPAAASDPIRGAASIAAALGGIGVGIYCTIVATVLNIWITVNIAIIERYLELRNG